MEYGSRTPIQGKNGYEKTSLTMKTIAELIAEENAAEEAREENASAVAAPQQQEELQQPPHMRSRVEGKEAFPPLEPAQNLPEDLKPEKKKRSFLGRIFG